MNKNKIPIYEVTQFPEYERHIVGYAERLEDGSLKWDRSLFDPDKQHMARSWTLLPDGTTRTDSIDLIFHLPRCRVEVIEEE